MQSSLFDGFSIELSGLLQNAKNDNRFLFVCVERLTGWSVVKAAKRATAAEVQEFVQAEIVTPSGGPRIIASDNSICFRAHHLKFYMRGCRTEWRILLAYASMSNRGAGKMVGTLKKVRDDSPRIAANNEMKLLIMSCSGTVCVP